MKRLTLKEARDAKGWTQVELAERADMQQSDISAIEVGRRKWIEPATMEKLSAAFGMPAYLSVAGLVFEERSEP